MESLNQICLTAQSAHWINQRLPNIAERKGLIEIEQNTQKNHAFTMDYALFCFFVCSVLGWCLEVIWRSGRHLEFYIPGFLFGPYCPIYGFGMLMILILGKTGSKFIVFLKIVISMSAMEYVISFFIEIVFGKLLWDYSAMPLHIGARVCVPFSIAWGILGIAALTWVEPKLKAVYFGHRKQFRCMTYIGVIVLVIDTVCSVIL